jgi:hypothetical protein
VLRIKEKNLRGRKKEDAEITQQELYDVHSTTTNSRPMKSAEQASRVQTSETRNFNCGRRQRTSYETRVLIGENIEKRYKGTGRADAQMIQMAHNRNL